MSPTPKHPSDRAAPDDEAPAAQEDDGARTAMPRGPEAAPLASVPADGTGRLLRAGAGLLVVAALSPLGLAAARLIESLINRPDAALAGAIRVLGSSATAMTAVAATTAAALALLLGAALAAFLATPPRGRWGRGAHAALGAAALAPLAIPPVALGGVMADLTGLGPAPLAGPAPTAAWAALTFVWALGWTPLAAAAVWAVGRRLPAPEHAAAAVMLGPGRRLRVLWWPHLRGPILFLLVAVAALAAADATTPVHLGLETAATRLATTWQTTLDATEPLAAAVPVWVALVLVLAAAFPARIATSPAHAGALFRKRARPSRLATAVTVIYAAAAFVLPAVWLASHREGPWPRLLAHGAEIAGTLRVVAVAGCAAAVAACGVAAAAALRATRPSRPGRPKRLLRAALATPLLVPGVVLGLILVPVAAAFPPSCDTPLWWAALLLRTLPWALLVTLLLNPTGDRAAAALGMADTSRVRLALRLDAPRLAAVAALAATAAAAREVDLLSVYALPGTETLALRAAQLLHFGLPGKPCDLLLLQLLLAALWSLPALLILDRRPSRRPRTSQPRHSKTP